MNLMAEGNPHRKKQSPATAPSDCIVVILIDSSYNESSGISIKCVNELENRPNSETKSQTTEERVTPTIVKQDAFCFFMQNKAERKKKYRVLYSSVKNC